MKPTNLTILLTLLFVVSACNTIAGIGQDVKETGEVIENIAD